MAAGRRLLVINIARIGDTLLATPLLRALKASAPDVHLGCIAHPKRAEVLEGLPFIDTLIRSTPKRLRFCGRLPGRSWDTAFVLGREAALVRYGLRVARRVVAFRQPDEGLNRRLWRLVEPPPEVVHAVRERLMLAEAVGVASPDRALAYRVMPDEAAWARGWLRRQGLAGQRPLIALQLSSFPAKAYRDWPLGHFIALARALLAAFPGARFLLTGGVESRERSGRFADTFPDRVVDTCGVFPLRRSAALLAQADLYVGVDTGPTHLAGALGIPMVALYHCRHRGRHLAPPDAPFRKIVEHPAPDRQCGPDTPMEAIGVARVAEAACALLHKGGRG